MQAALFGFKTGMERSDERKPYARIGSFLFLEFDNLHFAQEFMAGYRSGMARIWRTTYELPKNADTPRRRGVRFAWLCHLYGSKYENDQFPEASLCM
jgi:hypothetical protein